MRTWVWFVAAIWVLAVAAAAPGQICKDYLYSTDLGSDLDASDPSGNGVVGTMDCGAIYRVDTQAQPDPQPMLWKDDDMPAMWQGVPFQFAPQPIPNQPTPPGPSFAGFIPEQTVEQAYAAYFDLDGEDEIAFAVVDYFDLPGSFVQMTAQEFETAGIYRPGLDNVRLSFENDFAPGWFDANHPSDVPTIVKTDNDFETYVAGVSCQAPLPNTATPECLEVDLGLVPYMPSAGQDHDDDVDALDWHPENPEFYRYRYFTADHEAHLGLDPGDIYMTVNDGTVNITPIIDDVTNIGVSDETDIDAWEFVYIDLGCAEELFGSDFVAPLMSNLDLMAAIFSVDQDDPDTPNVDESGGLNPNIIYMTNLAGQYAAVSGDYSHLFDENLDIFNEDIDALTVIPEPASLSLLAIGAVALIRRRKA